MFFPKRDIPSISGVFARLTLRNVIYAYAKRSGKRFVTKLAGESENDEEYGLRVWRVELEAIDAQRSNMSNDNK